MKVINKNSNGLQMSSKTFDHKKQKYVRITYFEENKGNLEFDDIQSNT